MRRPLLALAAVLIICHPTIAETQWTRPTGLTSGSAAATAKQRDPLPITEAGLVASMRAASSGRIWNGTLVGAAVGAGIGMFFGYLFDNEQDCIPEQCPPARNYWWMTGLVGAGAGTLIGTLIAWQRR